MAVGAGVAVGRGVAEAVGEAATVAVVPVVGVDSGLTGVLDTVGVPVGVAMRGVRVGVGVGAGAKDRQPPMAANVPAPIKACMAVRRLSRRTELFCL